MKQPQPSAQSLKLRANRHVAVFVSLVATVSLTILLLAVLATPPLTSTVWQVLFAADAPQSLDAIFRTDAPVAPGRWRYVYVHHSRTVGGDATTLSQGGEGSAAGEGSAPFADHFVICNGDGSRDGEVQMTQLWNHQQAIPAPLAPPGAKLSDSCISVCVVGDFAHGRPTPDQQRRLGQLVAALQVRLNIPPAAVFVHPEIQTAAGAGRLFPEAAFRDQLAR